jgi:hypothetical protein
MVAAVGWVPTDNQRERGTLAAQFHHSETPYVYNDVPWWEFIEVITDADSQGAAFDRLIKKGSYPYRKSTFEEVAWL